MPMQPLLDMEISVDFVEDYLDASGGFERYRRATGWNPPKPKEPAPMAKNTPIALQTQTLRALFSSAHPACGLAPC